MRKTLPEKAESGRIRDGYFASTEGYGPCGAFKFMGPNGLELVVIATDGLDGTSWEHVSVSSNRRTPNWNEMNFVKDLWWDENETVVQFHPRKAKHVNQHPYCLHLWKRVGADYVLPPVDLVGGYVDA